MVLDENTFFISHRFIHCKEYIHYIEETRVCELISINIHPEVSVCGDVDLRDVDLKESIEKVKFKTRSDSIIDVLSINIEFKNDTRNYEPEFLQ